MIPQAIANTGEYADLWSQLKSMSHALERAQAAKNLKDVAELDKARLRALCAFLRNELETTDVKSPITFQAFLISKPGEPRYTLDVDIREILNDLPSFKQWLKTQRLSFKDKAGRLITNLEEYTEKVAASLFPANPPKDEFAILHELLTKLLTQTEAALVS